jgi:hypothetical protein
LYLRTKAAAAFEIDLMAGICWTVTSTDRDGRPTERTGTFPRMSKFAHVVIFDSRRDYGRAGGRYAVSYLRADRKTVIAGPPSYVAKTQRDVADFLASLCEPVA